MASLRNRILNRLIPGRVRRRHEYLMSTVPSYRESVEMNVDGEAWHVPADRRAALRRSLEWQSHAADDTRRLYR
jgi:hypothetical protein